MKTLRTVGIATAMLLACTLSTIHAQTPGPNYVPTRFDLYSATADLWRTDGGFQSTIRLTNVLAIAPIDVNVTLHMADGTPYPLPPVHLGISGSATVNINAALAVAPSSLNGHQSQNGSATFQYRYDWAGAVLGSISILDTVRSLQYVSQFMFVDLAATATPSSHHMMEGMWWQYSPATKVYVSVANPTDATEDADLAVIGQTGEALGKRHFSLSPHASTLSLLNDLIGTSPSATVGGIEISYAGAPHSLLFSGGIEDDAAGYSAQLRLSMSMAGMTSATTGTPSSCTVASAGLMVGKPDPMEGFPPTVAFSLFGYARNTSASPITLHALTNYMDRAGPHSVPAADQVLQAGETRNLNLAQLVRPPFKDGAANVSFTYNAQCGSLLLTTGSVDATGSYVFEVEPEAVSQSWGRISHFWQVGTGTDTMYTVWNPSSQAEDLVVAVYYNQAEGVYHHPLHLEPNASAMISVMELIHKGAPDADGHIIPPTASMGSLTISNKDPDLRHLLTFVVSSGIYNPVAGTCCGNPTICNGATGSNVNPTSFTVPVAGHQGLQFYVTESAGGQLNYTSTAAWSSNNTPVLTEQSGGSATGVAPGSAIANASISGIAIYAQVCPPAGCPTGGQGANAPATVPPVVSLSVISAPTDLILSKNGGTSGAGTLLVNAQISGGFTGTKSGTMTVSQPINTNHIVLTSGASAQSYPFTLGPGGATDGMCTPTELNCFNIQVGAANTVTGSLIYTVTVDPSSAYSINSSTSPKVITFTVR